MSTQHATAPTDARVGTVTYTTFEGHQLELTPWLGEHVALLAPPHMDLDPQVVAGKIAALDEAWEYYQSITGREPTPWAATTYQGRATIAVVDETCGAGCGYLGFTGIEILQSFFEAAYQELALTGRHDQIHFYELGRNFWFYGDQLGAIDAFVTGFAIVNRFQSMEAAGVDGSFQGGDFEAVRHAILHDMGQLYLADPATDGLEALTTNPPANPMNFGSADLAASLFFRIQEDFGDEAYAQFWQAMGTLPQAQTPQAAIDNFLQAAQSATTLDYSALFKTGWTLEVGDATNDILTLGSAAGPEAAFGFDGHDHLTGSVSSDHLFGGAGNDLLNGGRGADALIGSLGRDTYIVDDAADRVLETSASGSMNIDIVRASVSLRLGAHVEHLTLTGAAALSGTGNGLANTLMGNGGANRLSGLGGDDLLRGGWGADDLRGGAGHDDLVGGSGKDRLRGGAGADDIIFTKVTDSGPSAAERDIIRGFDAQDRIHLRAIDAIAGGGDDAFRLDQGGAFAAGEIRQAQVAAGTLLEINVDGDPQAEMSILLAGFQGALNTGDFVL